MKACSRLTLAFLLLILTVPPVVGDSPRGGPYVEYYNDGKKKAESHYKNGKKNALWTAWRENGQKRREVHF
jgi:hypothetical protein